MNAVLVDSNVLLDVLTRDVRWYEWSSQAIARVGSESILVINPVVYAEVSVGFLRIEEVDDALAPEVFRREALPWDAAFLAGKAFAMYRRRGGLRTSPLPDFFIGAHAAVRGMTLLTRDATRYRTYFPKLSLLAP
ncbi:MAG TPA: type II toxin-antitoxin system VapC family toxin [Thermodesulfobacteriota bacterium]